MADRIRDSRIAEEIAAQAGTDSTPPLFLNDALTPVIFGPQRPPLASSGYFPGHMGANIAAAASNTSHIGIFCSGAAADTIVRVNSIWIINQTAGVLGYDFRRVDDIAGFTLATLVPAYISAGIPATGAVFRAQRNDTVGASGTFMAQVVVEPTSLERFDGPWILNNGALVVTCTTVNTAVRVLMSFEAWPAIRQQPIPG